MRLLVVSHTEHYEQDGRVVGWGPTVREISRLALLFDELVHVAPLHHGPAPASALPYEAANVRLVPVRPAGGETAGAKLGVLRVWPDYLRTLLKELRRCDVVHVRCPSNIGLLAILLLALRRTPRRRWIKYAGNWRPIAPEWRSYELQRWLLARGAARAVVTVNGRWPDQPGHVRPFLNPCLTDEELREGALVGAAKRLASPVRLLFVGRIEDSKGCGRAVDIVETLSRKGIDVRLDLVGDGPDRAALASRIGAAGLSPRVRLFGWVPRPALNDLYRESHILLFPSSSSEGWPKVLSEGMAYGVVPVASTVSSIPQYLETFRAGRALDPLDREAFVGAISAYVREPYRWEEESSRAMKAAAEFTYASYLAAVRDILDLEAA
jgi:glycosyltransferase involved in cell wall biosynthesis